MRIDVHFDYIGTHCPPRCRKFRDIKLTDICEVLIQETTSAEAPVAIRYRGYRFDDKNDETELITCQDRLWEKSDRTLEQLASMLAPQCHVYSASRPRSEAMHDPALGQFQDYDSHAEAKRTIRSKASDFLLCDGQLYEYAEEPFWQITHGLGWCSISLSSWNPEREREWGSHYSFRADQLEAAIQCVRMENTDDYKIEGSCDVLIPAALRLDPYGDARKVKLVDIADRIKALEEHLAVGTTKQTTREVGEAIGGAVATIAQNLRWSAHERMAFVEGLMSKIET